MFIRLSQNSENTPLVGDIPWGKSLNSPAPGRVRRYSERRLGVAGSQPPKPEPLDVEKLRTNSRVGWTSVFGIRRGRFPTVFAEPPR